MNAGMTDRRRFVRAAVGAVAAGAAERLAASQRPRAAERLYLRVDDKKLQARYDAALVSLRANTVRVNRFIEPVLIEGGGYPGVWLECAPLEGLIYGFISQQVAIANHNIFLDFQREDGYFPCYIWRNKIGTSQIQTVVPIAATAFELYERTRDRAFLSRAYSACSRWDAWLCQYRNTRGASLCEAFCEFDTGHDNSPRFKGKPRECPNEDARICPKSDGLPYLAPDLSASMYGGRVALASMARELGKAEEEARWTERALATRVAIMDRLYDPRDTCFYDLDSNNRFVRVRGDALTRVLGERVVTPELFEAIYRKHIRNPASFWTLYPFPSIALDDASFVRPIPKNSWGGASQALTALRAPRWMEYYGKRADLTHLMRQWVKAIVAAPEFLQQMDPQTGEFTSDRGPYSPAMLALLDFAWRLYGVRREGATLEWNCRLPEGAGWCHSSIPTPRGAAELNTSLDSSELSVDGRIVLQVRGHARIVTDNAAKPLRLVGTEPHPAEVTLRWPNGRTINYHLVPDTIVPLA
jgi:hypothetical protein